jgi:hypothetical protein
MIDEESNVIGKWQRDCNLYSDGRWDSVKGR